MGLVFEIAPLGSNDENERKSLEIVPRLSPSHKSMRTQTFVMVIPLGALGGT